MKLLEIISKTLQQQREDLIEKIMIEVETMRRYKDNKIDYLPLYKFLNKL